MEALRRPPDMLEFELGSDTITCSKRESNKQELKSTSVCSSSWRQWCHSASNSSTVRPNSAASLAVTLSRLLIATWYREGPAMTQQFKRNHGHPDGDLLARIQAYEWFVETRKHYSNIYYNDCKTAWNKEWTACSKVGLMHHVMNAIYESVQVLLKTHNDHKEAFPQVPKRIWMPRVLNPVTTDA